MYRAPTPRERERRHALWLLAQGRLASKVAELLERDAHTIGAWLAALDRNGPAAQAFEQTGGTPRGSGFILVQQRVLQRDFDVRTRLLRDDPPMRFDNFGATVGISIKRIRHQRRSLVAVRVFRAKERFLALSSLSARDSGVC